MANFTSQFVTAQVSCNGTAAVVAAARATRAAVLVTNTDATNAVFLGATSAVTTSTGHKLAAGASISIPMSRDVYGITASATVVVCVTEVYE